ncbi:signal protein [Secundilactobacillus oryzae JCM 18671]|uniref:Cyclic-di-AMP phosphodiesterase n=1 Tax=Secundilactobacillus oryzae JCM 18671 TaxID=1291743 RepID=A0A081BHI9_9LACO|nr:DHH family phosphoesterase [Secundilactobacillus oryzae]GAK47507.1 signal protein [Secundilactobacillus oryzae JCM 18671]
MKKLFSWENMPEFLLNKRLRGITIFIGILSLIGIWLAFVYSWILGLIGVIAVIIGLYMTFNAMNEIGKDTTRYIADLSYRIKRGEQEALLEIPVGVIIFSESNDIEWVNPYIQRYFGDQMVLGEKLEDVDPELAELIAGQSEESTIKTVSWHDYKISLLVQKELRVAYVMDITNYENISQLYNDEKLALGQIFLDNYDEITQSMTDQEISNLRNYVTNELSSWAQEFGMYIKQLDDDHFFLLTYAKTLKRIEEDKFKILDVIRESTSKQNFPLTLSIGISYDDLNLNHLADQAQSNLDLALGRGGDQVVVKAQDEEARFYGGKTNPMEKRTRVRARMISQALQELMNESDQVFVQGHLHPDMDSVGACLGIRRIAKMNHKDCWIVLDQENVHSDIQRLLEVLKDYPEVMASIITPAEALEKATKQSLLIMVDHSKTTLSIAPELYNKLENRVMIIDHHRRGEAFPENPILVYIEPYASSTCELITEMFEYQSQEEEPINKVEATAMLTGIFIDTKSFSLRTGTRTFDAASYLRSAGADSVQMQELMKENVDSYLARNHLIELVDFIDKDKAIVVGEDDQIYDSVTAAQAADDLLNMSGVDASFVITKRDDGQVGVSARSLGDYNVQLIMEQMGGGGHLSSGATQIEGKTIMEVKQRLIDILAENDAPETESDAE